MPTTDDYKIRVLMDRTDAVAGARETAEAVEGMGESAEESAGGFNKLLEEAGGMRESRKLATEFFETLRGGGDTVSGLAGLFRFAFLTMGAEALGPLSLAIVGVGAALTSLLAKSDDREGAKDQIKDTKDATDLLKDSFDAARDAGKAQIDALTSSLKEYLAVQQQVLDVEERRGVLAKQRITDAEAEAAAQNKLAVASLETQKAQELAAATSDDQRKSIEAKYKVLEAAATGAGADAQHGLKGQQFDAEETAARNEIYTRQHDLDEQQKRLEALRVDAKDKSNRASQWGDDYQPDAAGSFEAAQKRAEQAVQDASKKLSDSQADPNWLREQIVNPARSQEMKDQHAKQIKDAQEELTISSTRLADIRDANAARAAFEKSSGELTPKIDENTKALDKLSDLLEHIASERKVEGIDYEGAKEKELGEHITAAHDAEIAALKQGMDQFGKELENKILAKQNQLDGTNNKSPEYQQLQQQIAQLQGQKVLLERDKKIATGDIDADSPDAKNYDLQAQGILAKAGAKTEAEQAKAENAALKARVESLEKAIAARPDHAALEPFVKQAEAQTDLSQRAQELQTIFNSQLGAVLSITQAMQSQHAKLRADTDKNTHAINSLRSNMGH